MPLGFENNGVTASLIQNSGNYMANQLIETGKTIQGILLRNQAFRETRELGDQLSKINPADDNYPQIAAAIVSQHPLAIQTGLAKQVLEPGMKAYAAAQAFKRTDAQIKGRVAMHGGGDTPVFIPNGGDGSGPRPDVSNFNQDPLAESNLPAPPTNGGGIAGVLKGTFDTMKGDEPAPEADASVLPAPGEIPDAASAMRQRKTSRPLQSYIDEKAQIFNDALAAHKATPFLRSQISTLAAREKAADDKALAAENPAPKVKATLADANGDLYRELADGSFLYPDGSKHLAAPNGLTRVAGANEERRLNQAKEAFDYRKERNVQTDAQKESIRVEQRNKLAQTNEAKGIKAALDLLKDREKTEIKTLRDFEKEAAKDPENPTLRAKVAAQQKLAEETVGRRDATEKKYESFLNGDSGSAATEIITAPNGKKYEVNHATKQVIREVP